MGTGHLHFEDWVASRPTITDNQIAHENPRFYEVPRKLARRFIGREDVLSNIDDYFSNTDVPSPKALILHALGGQGKSQIALKYCERSRESHQAIFWINASSKMTTTEGFVRIAAILDQSAASGLRDSDQKIKHVLELLENWTARWILIFDNHDTPEAFDLNEFFPRCRSAHLKVPLPKHD